MPRERFEEKVAPGLYRHWKGNLYRVLFVARGLYQGTIAPDAEVCVFINKSDNLGPYVGLPGDLARRNNSSFEKLLFTARNSTDAAIPEIDVSSISNPTVYFVVYLALYGNGRVSVREVGEFLAGAPDGRPRFERVAEDADGTLKGCAR